MSNVLECVHCEQPVESAEYGDYAQHVENCKSRPITYGDMEKLERQIEEIHQFVAGVASALNSPMVKSMLPPNVRGMLGN